MNKPEYYIGLMSGTSVDSIDAVLVDFSHQPLRLVASYQQAWSAEFKQALLDLSQLKRDPSLAEILHLDTQAAEGFIIAVQGLLKKAQIPASEIRAIGSHGQTLYHRPPTQTAQGNTWQIGDAHLIAAKTGILTVADFRRADMAVGGQGAPLVPTFHQYLFAQTPNTAALNIGGMANVSILENDPHELIGFDTGPGNGLMDAWIQQQQGQAYDKDGAWAATGTIQQDVLNALLADAYFQRPLPKSTGRDYFNLAWLRQRYPKLDSLKPADVQASLQALSAQSIVDALKPYKLAQLLVCGGGVHNQGLMQALSKQSPYPVRSSADVGVDPDWLEACCFAWLAQQRLLEKPANSPSVTGASQRVLLGVLYHRATGM